MEDSADRVLGKPHVNAKRLLLRFRESLAARLTLEPLDAVPSATGLHHLDIDDRVRLGREIMADVYIARRADKFFGNGRSNVAAFIALLKDWNAGDCILGAPSLLMKRNLFIHIVPR